MKKKNGFTLIELLIVVGIIGILVGLLAPAIFKTTTTANTKKHQVEMEVLHSAFLEYYHDNKGWPLPKDPKSEGAVNGKDLFGVVNPRVFIYSAKNSSKVWNRLLKVGADKNYNIKKRDYLDVRSVSAVKSYDESDPSRNIEDGKLGSPAELWGVDKKINGPLVYWSEFIECPKCGKWSNNFEKCVNMDCPERLKNLKQNSSDPQYKFTKKDKKKNKRRGVLGYRIQFDLNSNVVTILDTDS